MSKLHLIGVTLVCLMVLNNCDSRVSDTEKNHFSRLQGIWEHTGYGDVYVIEKKFATIYQYTRATCLQSDKLDEKKFGKHLIDIVVQDNGATFTAISSDKSAFRLHFSRLKTLPEVCSEEKRITGFAPVKIFEHVWHTFNDYYAFFKERGVDWQAQYAALRNQVHEGMSKRTLFIILCKLLAPIDDGHVYLESRSEEFSPEKPRGVEAIFNKGFKRQSKFDKYRKYVSMQKTRYREILGNYLDKNSVHHAGGASGKLLTWGKISHRVGYLLVKSMSSISTKRSASSLDDVRAVQEIMDRVMRDLRDTQAMIIDVRFNGGGDDAVSLAIANRFTDKRRLAMTKTARSYRGETPRREAYLVPEGDTPYLRPVAVIAGPDSASATEIFVMAMRALPQVTQIGEPTNGIFSDELYKSLPKGWRFTLSNEVYYDHLGVCHEVTGIIPQIHVPVFSLSDLEKGHNSALETALKALAS
jgi:carboxyl-terminal processing protease